MKVAVVTGGSSGIGLEIAKSLMAQGHKVANWDLNPPKEHTEAIFVKCDVSSESSVKNALSETEKQLGTCDILINNCGLQFMSPIEEFPKEKWDLLVGVLLTGTFLCSKAVIPAMKKKNWGRIVNISSIHGKVASPFKAAYVASKHGVLGLAKVIAQEVAENGITVNSICPGFVDTPLMRNQVKNQMELNNLSEEKVLSDIFLKQQNIKKLTQSSQIADLVGYLCSDSASTITGEALNVSGGWGMGV